MSEVASDQVAHKAMRPLAGIAPSGLTLSCSLGRSPKPACRQWSCRVALSPSPSKANVR